MHPPDPPAPDPTAPAAPAPDAPAPKPFRQAVEAILAEAERHAAWLSELEAETAAARARRDQFAFSLEGLFRALGPHAARPYAARLAAIAEPAPERPVGRPAEDGRLAALKALLADWPDETITPLAGTEALRARGFELPKNYVANRFFGMEKRGVLVRVRTGRYRIVRTHPEMVGAEALRAEGA